MRRRYRLLYEIHHSGSVPIWYDPRARRWFDRRLTRPTGPYYGDVQRCHKFRKALSCARGLQNKFGSTDPLGEVVITRYSFKHGQRRMQDYVLIPRKARV